MILEIDTSVLDRIPNLTINQLVFLTLVLNENQNNNQDVQKLLSLVFEEDIQGLIDRKLLSATESDNTIIYSKAEQLDELLKEDKSMFDEFYELFPVYVIRPDGTKGFLRSNINKCRKQYNSIVGKSRAMHQHICNCLKFEIDNKMITGKIGYMKTMWKWLTQHEWETCEEQMKLEEPLIDNSYGTDIF